MTKEEILDEIQRAISDINKAFERTNDVKKAKKADVNAFTRVHDRLCGKIDALYWVQEMLEELEPRRY